jgi:hypothetical protein
MSHYLLQFILRKQQPYITTVYVYLRCQPYTYYTVGALALILKAVSLAPHRENMVMGYNTRENEPGRIEAIIVDKKDQLQAVPLWQESLSR